jgi:Mrp family chromosome partitioning ATPase
MTTADLRSVHELLIASKRTAPLAADDIRSEFDLIIVHAPPMSAYPDAASLAAHVDLVILVVAEKAVDSTAAAAAALLSRFGPAPVGLAINRVAAGPGVADRRRVPRAVAG